MIDEARGAKRYRKAPIVEAVIEMLVTLPPGLTLDDLARVHAEEVSNYPRTERRMALQTELHTDADTLAVTQQATQQQIGHVYTSNDGRRIFHSRFDGFMYSQLAPYDRWDSFASEALRLWDHYAEITKPASINRLGVRYVNRLDIPSQNFDINEYLRTRPEVSPDLPQDLTGYFFQVQLPLPSFGATSNITSTVAPSVTPGHAALILDIDCFQEMTLRSEDPGFDETLVSRLETLRSAKNIVFEASITQTTREMIDLWHIQSEAGPSVSPAT